MKNIFNIPKNLTDSSYLFIKKSGHLFGEISVGGAKNMVTKVMAAFLASDGGECLIKNIPFISEVSGILSSFEQLGVKYSFFPDRTLKVSFKNLKDFNVGETNAIGNRISVLMAGPLLKHFGKAIIKTPGGCKIGKRKIDFHLAGLQNFGVEIKEEDKFLKMKVKKGGLKGIKFKLPFPSVGATENMIITAACADGETVLSNCAVEPEIMGLIKILQRAGVSIIVNSDREITINSADSLHFKDVTIIPDRVETLSWASAALATKGDVFVKNACQDHIVTPLGILEKMGAGIEINHDGIRFYYKGDLKPVNVRTEIYPGFATDFGQPFVILLSQISGKSIMHETIFENRLGYLEMLNNIVVKNKFILKNDCPKNEPCRFKGQGHRHLAEINGPVEFGEGEVEIQDLRAGFALIIAGLLSRGLKIKSLDMLFRGYENPISKLKSLGADVELVN
jgi:UDP-N-acetylglucosamine 1-carboxyvinyltransferase